MTTTEAPPTRPVLPAARHASLRLHLLGRSVVVMLTAMVGVALFCGWVTVVAVSILTPAAILVLPATALVRSYAGTHRRSAARLLGRPVEASYRTSDRPGPLRRVWSIVRDPASWRDAGWLVAHGVVGFATATLAVALFLATVFYLAYPFLFWVTPEHVFGRPFGGWMAFHSVADSTIMLALAPVTFGLWWALQIPLTRAELGVTHALLQGR